MDEKGGEGEKETATTCKDTNATEEGTVQENGGSTPL